MKSNHTLYYYDQAGNLISTVPPKGVNTETQDHTYHSGYQYNAQNQMLSSTVPDHAGKDAKTDFYYDAVSQLRFTQNPRQKDLDTKQQFSYTKYDNLGRVREVGQLTLPKEFVFQKALYFYNNDFPSKQTLDALKVTDYSFDQITYSQYDRFTISDIEQFASYFKTNKDFEAWKLNIEKGLQRIKIQNGRNRIVATINMKQKAAYDERGSITLYSYDSQGNVKQLVKILPGLAFKSMHYDFDILTGNVNRLDYQLGYDDQFSHRYTYDADNRLTAAYSSVDGHVWMREATYKYYPHCPLAVELCGEEALQKLDYHYTLQGWLKGVNKVDHATKTAVRNADIFDYSLGYFGGDFRSISNASASANKIPKAVASNDLYNGNIRWMQTNLLGLKRIDEESKQTNKTPIQTDLLRSFEYDQLNRISASKSYTLDANNTFADANGKWDVNYTYDANGNLLTLNRNEQNAKLLEEYGYDYINNSNKLISVKNVSTTAAGIIKSSTIKSLPQSGQLVEELKVEDVSITDGKKEVEALNSIELGDGFKVDGGAFYAKLLSKPDFVANQEDDNYVYDANGNLIEDKSEGLKIRWNSRQKVVQIAKKERDILIDFEYDEMANRIRKTVRERGGTCLTAVDDAGYCLKKDDHYLVDATGNMLAVYDKGYLKNHYIYGSSRLGEYSSNIKVKGDLLSMGKGLQGQKVFGLRRYEMKNHLGNVLTTIGDEKFRVNSDPVGQTLRLVVKSATDYYPFGAVLPGRVYSKKDYRFGFQGQEEDDETSLVNYKYRMHNPRIGRFFSVDPLAPKYPHNSPYAFSENRVIDGVELEGLEWESAKDDQGKTNVSVNTNLSVDNNTLSLSKNQISAYKNAISSQLNSTLKSSSGGEISGIVTFNGDNGNGRLVPSINLYGQKHTGGADDPMIAGTSTFNYIGINLYNKGGSLKSPELVGEDVVHELFHTIRFEHPFVKTQGADTKLIHQGGSNYSTSSTTDPTIFYNIMNYPMINIDGENLGQLWKERSPTLITSDQINLMLNEINLQKQGYGIRPKYDKNISQDENNTRFNELYQNYWFNTPGQDVSKKK